MILERESVLERERERRKLEDRKGRRGADFWGGKKWRGGRVGEVYGRRQSV